MRDGFATDQDLGPGHIPPPLPAGWEVAIEEARKDPEVESPVGAGKFRYNLDPDKYDRIASHSGCPRCSGKGQVLKPYSQGSGGYMPCPGEEQQT
jgi:hypothetical protein